jgi:hypothetical protein
MKKFFKFLGAMLKPLMPKAKVLATELFKTISMEVLDIASAAVKQASMEPGLSVSEKRKMARDCIRKDMKKRGKTVKESVINTALEVAYQKLRQETVDKVMR